MVKITIFEYRLRSFCEHVTIYFDDDIIRFLRLYVNHTANKTIRRQIFNTLNIYEYQFCIFNDYLHLRYNTFGLSIYYHIIKC